MDCRIAFFSFADIDNFGDILFSHIFKLEIEKRIPNVIIDFYTPSEYNVEGLSYIAYNKDKVKDKYNALILFGGEVIHLYDEKTWKPIYKKNRKKIETKLPSDVVFDWSDINSAYKAWISVGVRPINRKKDFEKINKTLSQLDYVSTRGTLSKKILENNVLEYSDQKINITPDMGWLFPNLLDSKNLRGKLVKNHIQFKKYLVFQINNINEQEAKQIALYLLKFREKHKIEIVLLPIIRPWEDYKYLKMIQNFANDEFLLLDNNLSILEIADIIVHSHISLSSSLHASITALSAGIPAAIINKWNGTKLQDIFGHQFRLHMLKHNLEDIPTLLDNLIKEKNEEAENLKVYSEFMQVKLDLVFNNLVKEIKNHKNSF